MEATMNSHISISMTSIYKTLIMVIAASMLGGCTTTVTKLYPGPELRRDRVAVLTAPHNVRVLAVDGEAKRYSPSLYMIQGKFGTEIHLLPGLHTVSVRYSTSGPGSHSREDLLLQFEAKAGRIYWIDPRVRFDPRVRVSEWAPYVVDITENSDLPEHLRPK
jgi:hypothetical protein